jgi:hypothetical protein
MSCWRSRWTGNELGGGWRLEARGWRLGRAEGAEKELKKSLVGLFKKHGG